MGVTLDLPLTFLREAVRRWEMQWREGGREKQELTAEGRLKAEVGWSS